MTETPGGVSGQLIEEARQRAERSLRGDRTASRLWLAFFVAASLAFLTALATGGIPGPIAATIFAGVCLLCALPASIRMVRRDSRRLAGLSGAPHSMVVAADVAGRHAGTRLTLSDDTGVVGLVIARPAIVKALRGGDLRVLVYGEVRVGAPVICVHPKLGLIARSELRAPGPTA